MRLTALMIMIAALAVLTAGCTDRNNSAVPAKGPDPVVAANTNNTPTEDTGTLSAGRKVYDANNCARCHRIDTAGAPPKGMGKAPNLTKVGGKRSNEWIAAHVRDPKTHGGKMPPYPESKISDDDLKALADYLGSLK
jgi:mono/diheme cytochrome c family protein